MDFRLLLAGSPEPLSGVMLPSFQAYSQLMAFTMTTSSATPNRDLLVSARPLSIPTQAAPTFVGSSPPLSPRPALAMQVTGSAMTRVVFQDVV